MGIRPALHAPACILRNGVAGPGAEDAEVGADLDDDRGDGTAAGDVVQLALGGPDGKHLGVQSDGAAQAAVDAGEVGRGDAVMQGGDELLAAEDEPAEQDEADEPAGDGEQTVLACEGVGQARGLRRGGHGRGLNHAAAACVKENNHESYFLYRAPARSVRDPRPVAGRDQAREERASLSAVRGRACPSFPAGRRGRAGCSAQSPSASHREPAAA